MPKGNTDNTMSTVTQRRRPAPLAATLITLVTCASLGAQQAISIESDQQLRQQAQLPASKSENSAPATMAQVTKSIAPQATATTTSAARKPPPALTQSSAKQLNGRVRNRSPPTTTTTTTSTTRQPADPAYDLMVDEEIQRAMSEYKNTPPLFVTPTRDFFVDVARYSLGFKLTTMQALDSEGDRIEYSLKPASYRDASPYFTINATSGELRLANRRIPLQGAISSDRAPPASSAIEEEEEPDDDSMGASRAVELEEAPAEKPSYLYFLNVAANDGRHTSVVELQIHVFNSTSFGTKSPVQLTIEGGRRGGESLMRAKTSEFFEKLYPRLGHSTLAPVPNSTLVFPSFVNPSLPMAPASAQVGATEPEDFATVSAPTFLRGTDFPPVPNNELNSGGSLAPQVSPPPLVVEPAAHLDVTHQAHHLEAIQQPLMLSLIIVICSCFTIALVLLVFVVPLSVKRLKKRLKNMELQHEQLSQKASSSGASSIVCSGSSTSGASTSSAASARHLPPSLSQFTLSSHSGHCSMLTQMADATHLHHRPQLGRQSSLDSATTSANFTSPSYNTSHSHYNAQLAPRPPPASGPAGERFKNGAIVNPAYLQRQQQQFLLQRSHFSPAMGESATHINIYCPIDDEFYSTINTESPAGADSNSGVGSLVGQTFDSRNYFASQCAPREARAGRHNEAHAPAVAGCQRDTDTPSSTSSRSSTRSLARFLSLPARRWSDGSQQARAEEGARHAGALGNFLDELEHHFGGATATLRHNSRLQAASDQRGAQTIARSSHVRREQQVRAPEARAEPNWELERHKLKFLDILDEGQFGLVWRCKLRSSDEGDKTVAVKTLKSLAAKDEREREELLAEIEIMKLVCSHPNVVRILHCCTRDIGASKPILLVMEHVELGKLQSFLERSRTSHNYATMPALVDGAPDYPAAASDHCDEGDESSSTYQANYQQQRQLLQREQRLTSRELIKFTYHVAKGMEYISSQCIVHRDLASRNILMSAERVCKIGDFGMARHMANRCDVYERRSRNTKIPVRWMAPEVLLQNSFTTKSDVYSFGILMWEIVTLGSTPYRHLKTDQIVEAVARRGERPARPDYCHALLYDIMSRCWSASPDERPNFAQLVRQLDELLNSSDEYIQLDQYPDHNYYNIPQTAAPLELL